MALEFLYLAQRPDELLTVASWYFDEWGHFHPTRTLEDAQERLKEALNIDRMPFILLALENGTVVGAAELKYREMADLFSEKEHWLGGVYVAAECRGRGIGSALANEIAARAPSYGVRELYLQTEHLDGGLYFGMGWQLEQQVDNHGIQVQIMVRTVGT